MRIFAGILIYIVIPILILKKPFIEPIRFRREICILVMYNLDNAFVISINIILNSLSLSVLCFATVSGEHLLALQV